ncbi:hypothetical protein SLS62_004198 [Diatrype stigma]|uniref:Peptidase M14 domain-containing protein n=1 Tax=Diatrype stigma TaxID=117547 RepID=A0AAN9UV91_9PEZI
MKSAAILSFSLLPSALGASVQREAKVDYAGYQSLRITLPEDVNGLGEQIENIAAHILNPGRKEHIDAVVSADKVNAIKSLTPDVEVLVEDVGAAIAEEGDLIATAAVPSETWFTAYHSYDDHIQFLHDLQEGFPENSEIITAGTSVEGRVLTGIHIWGSGGKGTKPAVLFHGTVHAREWIATMVAEYQAWQLLTKYDTDAAVKALVDDFDFHIIPIVNPDGFVYTQTTDRLWRKNRQRVSGDSCIGRDINRNWPYKWEVTGGASTNPCSETYKGQAAGDTPENVGLVAHANSLRDSQGIRLFIDFHSYGQYILWPYGYDCNVLPPDNAALRAAAAAAQSAVQGVSGTRYTVGPSCSTLYATTGSAPDYVYAVSGANYSYTMELRDTGRYGFVLPAQQIQPTVTETWQGVLAALGGIR